MTIIATPGDPTANSYATMAEAEAYFENHPQLETWSESTIQEEALMWATIRLDEYDYVGEPATDTQALKWPRIDDEIFTLEWTNIEIPPRLKYAQFELALAFISSYGSGVSSTTSQPVSSLKLGTSVEVKYDTSGGVAVDTSVDWTGIPVQAARFLKGLRTPALFA